MIIRGAAMTLPLQAPARRAALRLVPWAAALALAGCASTTPTHTPARIEIQEDVGFTIVEEAKIPASVRSDYEQAMLLLEQGRHADGVALLESITQIEPGLSAPRIDLGIAYHRAGDLERARDSLLAALESNPRHPIAHNELGIVYRKLGRFGEARASYEAALQIYPNYHFARRNLGVLCDIYLADAACALEHYEAYMTTVPGDDEASMWIADLKSRTGQ